MEAVEVAAAAIIQHGRVLAARRTHPADVAGGWELPGGKVDSGETVAEAVVREVREELGCQVELVETLGGRSPIKPGYVLTAHVVDLVDGEPVPTEHDAVRWLSAEELDDVAWLPSDLPFLGQLRERLEAGHQLAGGNVGGAVRVGRTVRRAVGSWTPAVHTLLEHLAAKGIAGVPRVLGTDERGQEVLTYVPGHVMTLDEDEASEELLIDVVRWLRRFHGAVRGFESPGPWRTTPPATAEQIICHHDFAPYNAVVSSSATGDRLVGVFDWDMAGPGHPIDDLAFAAWNWVPLHCDSMPPERASRRVEVMATAYDDDISAREILEHVVSRINRSIRVIRDGAAAGDSGMLRLMQLGAADYTQRSLDRLKARMPSIIDCL
jgi:8-oxo-dGTP diphosphatase